MSCDRCIRGLSLMFLVGCYHLDFSGDQGGGDAYDQQILDTSGPFSGGPDVFVATDGPGARGGLVADSWSTATIADGGMPPDTAESGLGQDATDSPVVLEVGGGMDMSPAGSPSLVGTPCDVPNVFACDGAASKVQLVCESPSRTWRIMKKCTAGTSCDRESADCLPVVPECAGKKPGDRVCIDRAIHGCGPDLVTAPTVDTCDNVVGDCLRCKPRVLASGQTRPMGLVLTQDHVYWSNSFSAKSSLGLGIFRAPRKGGGAQAVAQGELWAAYAMVTDGSYVYWVNAASSPHAATGVHRVPVAGGEPTQVAVDPGGAGYGWPNIALDDRYVYWPTKNTDAIGRVPKSGGTVEPFATPGTSCIVADSQGIYWRGASGNILQATSDGGAPRTLAISDPGETSLALDNQYVYWTDGAFGNIKRARRTDGSVETLASGQVSPNAIVVDASHVYWMLRQGSLMRAPLAGGAPVLIDAGQGANGWLAVDSTSVCWTGISSAETDGTITCLDK